MRSLAVFFSYLLHPVFMLTYVTAFFVFTENHFSYFMSPAKKFFLMGAVFIFSVSLPLLNVFILKKLGYIKNMSMTGASERFMPYISAIVLHSGLLYILYDLDIPFFFKFLVIVSIAVLGLVFICNFFILISAHLAAIGGCFGIIAFYEFIAFVPSLWPLCICLALAGLAGYARLYLQAHRPKEVYLGFITGFLSSLVVLLLLTFYNITFK